MNIVRAELKPQLLLTTDLYSFTAGRCISLLLITMSLSRLFTTNSFSLLTGVKRVGCDRRKETKEKDARGVPRHVDSTPHSIIHVESGIPFNYKYNQVV